MGINNKIFYLSCKKLFQVKMALVVLVGIFVFWGIIYPGHALLGYDCGGPSLNITTFSLLEVGKCDIPMVVPNETVVNVQLLQVTHHQSVQGYQCRIKIDRQALRCGMFSHLVSVPKSRQIFYKDIDRHTCKVLVSTGTVRLSDTIIITSLKPNTSTTHTVRLAGKVDEDGDCDGQQYADAYGSYENVVVEAVVEISYATYQVSVNTEKDKVELSHGVTCPFNDGECIDIAGNQIFWETMPTDNCKFDSYKVIYEGRATKLSATAEEPEVYIAENAESTFALMAKSRLSICGYLIHKTELPKVFILEMTPSNNFPAKTKVTTEELDMFLYINAKIVYVERHVRTQMMNMYHHTRVRHCQLERDILSNALSLAPQFPDLFAYTVMKKYGYHAVVSGELIHLIGCIKTEAVFRKTDSCYSELPVYVGNNSYFLAPKTRILVRYGTPIDCNPLLPTGYQIDGLWYYFSPDLSTAPEPNIIQVDNAQGWSYKTLENLAANGIYTQEQLEQLNKRIMEDAEAKAVTRTVIRGATGHVVPTDSLTIENLFNPKSFDSFIEERAKKIWGKFLLFGSATSGVIGIFAVIHFFKLILNTIIHGYTIYQVWGWSTRIFGALWHSLALLFIHQGQNRQENANTSNTQFYRVANEDEKMEKNKVQGETHPENRVTLMSRMAPPPPPSTPGPQIREESTNIYPKI